MINLTTDQKINLTLTPQSSIGRTVPKSTINGVPLWNISDTNVGSLIVAADGFSAFLVAGSSGTANVSVIANAGTEASPIQITGSIAVTVIQAPAAQLAISASAIISQ